MDRQVALFGDDDPDTFRLIQALADVIRRQDRTDEAKALVKTAWDRRDG